MMNRAKLLGACLSALLLWSSVMGQEVQTLKQDAPVSLAAFRINSQGANVNIALTVTNTGNEKRVAALAVGVVLVDAFDDVIAVNYARWTDDLGILEVGERAELTNSFVATRADDLFQSVFFVYAVRFEDGELWKQDLSGVATELLSRFEVAASSNTLQP